MASLTKIAGSHNNALCGYDGTSLYLLRELPTAAPKWVTLPAIPTGTVVDIGEHGGAMIVVNNSGTVYKLTDTSAGFAWATLTASP